MVREWPVRLDGRWLEGVVEKLADSRPLFHSEADLQHALAWELHRSHPEAVVRLELRPDPALRESVDLVVVVDGCKVFIELKYLVRRLDLTVGGERVVLRDQGAQSLSRYDVLKDVARLERFCVGAHIGFAVVLANDPLVWGPSRPGGVDSAFKIHDGALVSGTMEWAEHTGLGSRRGREAPITLRGSYRMSWRSWPASVPELRESFRYLIVEVARRADLPRSIP